jgi:thioredoxin-like negative regulator of GroEL
VLERLLLVLAIVVVVVAAAFVARALTHQRLRRIVGTTVPSLLRERLRASSGAAPTVLYFFGPFCPACDDQARVVAELRAEGAVRVVELDAAREPALADQLGVVTVPTTAIVDSSGTVRHVNPGFYPKHALAAQLQGLWASPVAATLS